MQSLPLTPRWLDHFMTLAKFCAGMSKDPSTQVGAVIVRPDRTVVSTGFNGYPRMCDDSDYTNRERKYQRIVHAEMNAILSAREPVDGYTLFSWPIQPCERCMPHIIQSGIRELVVPDMDASQRWFESAVVARGMANEAGIRVVIWNLK